MEEFRVIVAGGRYFDDYELLEESLDHLLQNKPNAIIISGTAKGADSLGELYAKKNNLRIERFKPDWNKFAKSAGYKRNAEMAEVANALVAFFLAGYSFYFC